MSLAQDVGRHLEAHRERLGQSRRELARKLGVSDVTLLELERGTGNPTLERVEKVAADYGLTFSISAKSDLKRKATA